MQKLQLYIQGQRVDLFKDESVNFTQTLQNVKDISKVFTEFTKTFALPASKVNNKIFSHYYNANIDNSFDARIKVGSRIELNDLPFKEGMLKLDGVKLKNNVAHTYNVTFFGNTVNLKDLLGNTQLSGLSGLNAYNQPYTYTNFLSSLQGNTVSGGDIITPLITHTERLIYDSQNNPPPQIPENTSNIYPQGQNGVEWTQFKYAIRVQTIIDAIQSQVLSNGETLTFSDDFFNDPTNTKFHNLFLWLHRKKGDVESPDQLLQNFTQVTELNTTVCQPTNGCQPTWISQANGVVTTSVPSPYAMWFSFAEVTPPNNTDVYTVRVIRNGSIIQENTGTGVLTVISGAYNNSTFVIQIASSTTMTFTAGSIVFSGTWWKPPNLIGFGNTGSMVYSNSASFTTTAFSEFNIQEQIPKMTVIDFLSGLFKMFNLTAYVENSGTIVVRTLDSYYDAGSQIPINIDRYLDTTKSIVNVALPFKSVQFRYKGLGTFLAKQYEQRTNKGWGSLDYALDNEFFDALTKPYLLELPFEHMQYERLYNVQGGTSTTVQYGYFVDDNRESYFGEPLVFYPILQEGGTQIAVKKTEDNGTININTIDDYHIPSNTLDLLPISNETSIHFNNELSEYLANESGSLASDFEDTLFYTDYRKYITDVFNNKRRLTKVTAYLPMKIYYNLQLNDLIQLGQDNYKINSLTTNLTTGKTDFELLNDVQGVTSNTGGGTPPTQVTGLVASNITSTGYTLTWNASVSPVNNQMSYYVVYANGIAVGGSMASPLSPTYSDTITGQQTNTSFGVTVVAYDIFLNLSPISSILTVNTLP